MVVVLIFFRDRCSQCQIHDINCDVLPHRDQKHDDHRDDRISCKDFVSKIQERKESL